MSDNGNTGIEHKEISGNVFAALSQPAADGRLARSTQGFHVNNLLADRKLTQHQVAGLLDIN